jgi:predicted metal-dependent HD superfamily phosphohydrolase
VLRDLRAAYASPGRHYHTLGHALAVVRTVERERARLRRPDAVRLAAWFHDAVYDSRRGDNEARSADLARASLRRAGVPAAVVREACRLILLTRTHDCRIWDCDAAVLLDADLAILGSGARRYGSYARAVRREYGWVPADAFRGGRLRILREFLRRRRLFRTPALRARWEARARRNLRAECDRLARVPS